jgi:hypothetical protein
MNILDIFRNLIRLFTFSCWIKEKFGSFLLSLMCSVRRLEFLSKQITSKAYFCLISTLLWKVVIFIIIFNRLFLWKQITWRNFSLSHSLWENNSWLIFRVTTFGSCFQNIYWGIRNLCLNLCLRVVFQSIFNTFYYNCLIIGISWFLDEFGQFA